MNAELLCVPAMLLSYYFGILRLTALQPHSAEQDNVVYVTAFIFSGHSR